jgi:hypothetical protein
MKMSANPSNITIKQGMKPRLERLSFELALRVPAGLNFAMEWEHLSGVTLPRVVAPLAAGQGGRGGAVRGARRWQ